MKNKPLQTVLPLLSITKLNTLAKTLTNKQIPYQICEVCYQPRGLLLCQICKNNYHMKCLQISTIPLNFICPTCKVKFPSLTSPDAKQTHLTIYDDTKTVPHIQVQVYLPKNMTPKTFSPPKTATSLQHLQQHLS